MIKIDGEKLTPNQFASIVIADLVDDELPFLWQERLWHLFDLDDKGTRTDMDKITDREISEINNQIAKKCNAILKYLGRNPYHWELPDNYFDDKDGAKNVL